MHFGFALDSSETSRCLGDKQNVYWGYLYLTNLNLYLTNPHVLKMSSRRLEDQQMFAGHTFSVGFKMKPLRKRVFLC